MSRWLAIVMLASLTAGVPATQFAKAAKVSATFTPIGPGPITGGQTENVTPNNEVAGAVHTVVAHPGDANIMWIGTVNGGIWRTTNATAASPDWTPLTDQMPGLSIGALELDPTVASNTVLVAGIGRSSSFGILGGPLPGILRSTDGGGTWTPLGADDLTGENISGVAPRGNTIVVSANSPLFVGGQGGVFRSTNGGADFTRVSGAAGSGLSNTGFVFDLASDSANNARLYAATGAGIFRSDNTGAVWTNVTNQITGIGGTTNNIEMAVHNTAGNNVVYAGVNNNGTLNGLWRSVDQGANWTQLDTPQTIEGGTPIGIQPREKAGGQGGIHFSIRPDPTNANVVYVGGDRQPGPFPNSIGAQDFSGRLFRCDASLALGSQCAPITHNGTSNNSSPHADSREMVFDANGDMVEVNDGGVYRQTDPATNNGVWVSLNGDLQLAEHHSCDYDNVGNLVLCGDQDTGVPEQSASGSTSWQTVTAADGGFVAVNDDNAGTSVRFSASNNIGQNGFRRRLCDAGNNCINSAPGFNVVGQGQTFHQLEPACGPGVPNPCRPLYTPMFINKVDGTRLIIGAGNLYESTDSLDNLNIVVAAINGALTRAVAYGGRQSGADNPGVLWYGTGASQLFLRSGGGGVPAPVAGWTVANGAPVDMVLDPENWATAFVTNGTSVFRTTNAGLTFTNITGTLTNEAPGAQIWSLETMPIAGTSHFAVIAGTDTGTFVTQTQNLGIWAELGDNLPNTHAFDLHYDATDDVLLVGTMGRGSWLLNSASNAIPTADVSVTKTDSPDPVIAGEEEFYTVTVTNNGPDKAVGVVVTDELPDEVIYLEDNADCTYDAAEHRLTCPLGDIPSGASRSFDIKTRVPADTVATESDGTLLITNTVTVGSVSVDTDTSNNTATARTFVQDAADLAVVKICDPREARAGEAIHCAIYVDNHGPSDARGVVITDRMTSSGSFTISNVNGGAGAVCTPVTTIPGGKTFECNVGIIRAASTSQLGRKTLTYDVSASEGQQLDNHAKARSDTPDPDDTNNETQETLSIESVADLSLVKEGPTSVIAGTDATYTLTITNNGPSTAEGVVIEDALSSGVEVLSVSGSGGATCNAGVPGDALRPATCSYGNLAPGDTRTMTIDIRVLPDTVGVVHNDARVSSDTFDDDLSNNLDTTATDTSSDADLSITKADSPDPVLAGEELTYTITVTSSGPSTAQDVQITDEIPSGTTFVSGVNGNGTIVCTLVQIGTVVCDLGTMGPGESQTVFLTVLVDPSVPDGSTLVNGAEVSSSTPDGNTGNNTTTADTAVATAAELWLDKTGTLRSGNPAPVVVYTLTVHNDQGCEDDAQSSPTPTCGDGGPSDAQNITVTDTLPLDSKKLVVQFVSPQCTYTKATHTVSCTSSTVPAGASVQFVIEAQVQGSVGTITNAASLTSTTPDPNTANNSDSADIVVKGGTGKRK